MTMTINIGNTSYDIVVERGALKRFASLVDTSRRILVVTDDLVPSCWSESVVSQCPGAGLLVLPHGEDHKTVASMEAVWSKMQEMGFSRSDLLVAVGGGCTGDLCGFAAATYMRGIPFVNVPTTLLSQLDSSIGGKTAVNFGGVKNLIGAFHHPEKVIIDPDTLSTLSERLFAEGLAEAVKMAATSDAELFRLLETSNDIHADIERVIIAALNIKKQVVEADPTEKGLRRVLNFGHTVGHAVEAVSSRQADALRQGDSQRQADALRQGDPQGQSAGANGGFYHGESVAIGMMYMSEGQARERIGAVLEKYGLPQRDDCRTEDLMEAIGLDKKKAGDGVVTVRVEQIGSFEFRPTSMEEMEKLIRSNKQ